MLLRAAPKASPLRAARLGRGLCRYESSLPKFNPAPSFKLTEQPCPTWDLGQGIPPDAPLTEEWSKMLEQGWKSWAPDEVQGGVYKLLTSAVIPRPIAFVSTVSEDGVRNLAPMSYFNLVSHNPPLLFVSFSLSKRKPKDTRENIKATKEFTVNIISEPFAEAANVCSVEAPPYIDEWVVSGLTPEESTVVKPPRVKESAVGLECELYHFLDINSQDSGELTTTMVLGLIKQIHVRKGVLTDQDLVDPAKLRPIARLGGATFARLGEGFDISRPSWRALKDRIEAMSPRTPDREK